MRARQVEVTYARSGVKAILVDGEELDIRYIEDKSIENWFEPAHERRSSWKGLAEELRDKVGDENAVFSFDFFGPEESRTIFFRCLGEHGLGNAELSREDIIRRHLEDGRKAWNREQYLTAFQAYKNAAILGSPEGQFTLGEWYARILDFQLMPAETHVPVLYLDEKWSRPALAPLFPNAIPGRGAAVERIADTALEYYEHAAEQGWVPAQKMLYDILWGYKHRYWYAEIPRSEEEAVRWLTAAAESGDQEAEESLGRYHAEKRLAEERRQDEERRLAEEHRLAEEQRQADERRRLEFLLLARLGWYAEERRQAEERQQRQEIHHPAVEQLVSEIEIEQYVTAEAINLAIGGNQQAQYELACAYDRQCRAYREMASSLPEEDDQVFTLFDKSQKAHVLALEWYKKAAAQGYPDAVKTLERLRDETVKDTENEACKVVTLHENIDPFDLVYKAGDAALGPLGGILAGFAISPGRAAKKAASAAVDAVKDAEKWMPGKKKQGRKKRR